MKLSKQTLLKLKKKNIKQSKRKTFIRGTRERPRLTVYRSKNHIYAQLIDDQNSKTLVAVSSLERLIKLKTFQTKKSKISFFVGQFLAELSLKKNFTKIVFDRGPYLYRGCIKALADGAREGGLLF